MQNYVITTIITTKLNRLIIANRQMQGYSHAQQRW